MKFFSIPHIWLIIAGLILLTGPFYLTYGVISTLYSRGEIIPIEGYFALGIIATLGFWTIFIMIFFVKIIRISNHSISIIYPFRLKSYNYDISEIVMHTIYSNFGTLQNYQTVHFQTIDDKLFMIMQFEYWNFKRLKEFIVNNSKPGEISNYHNVKAVFWGLLISIVLTIVFITTYNEIIM